jgi:hypothetical protein
MTTHGRPSETHGRTRLQQRNELESVVQLLQLRAA